MKNKVEKMAENVLNIIDRSSVSVLDVLKYIINFDGEDGYPIDIIIEKGDDKSKSKILYITLDHSVGVKALHLYKNEGRNVELICSYIGMEVSIDI